MLLNEKKIKKNKSEKSLFSICETIFCSYSPLEILAAITDYIELIFTLLK